VAGRRDEVVIAKSSSSATRRRGRASASADRVRPPACDASLARLVSGTIGYYQHRLDPQVPIENRRRDAALVEPARCATGPVGGLTATVRRAHAVHPIAAVQTEYSLWAREPETALLPTLRELGVGFVPYSPLGRGFLTGAFTTPDDLAAGDFRSVDPRIGGGGLAANASLAATLEGLAEPLGVTSAARAGLGAARRHVVPIPGTKRRRWLEQNVAAAGLELDEATVAALEAAFFPGVAVGDRYYDMSGIDR
jgi:aryl-alcohol dehydrogenase-like predicted oxidoreductase